MTDLLARTEMYAMFAEKWLGEAGAIVGGEVPKIIWEGVTKDVPPPLESSYARVSIRTISSHQSSLGGVGNRRFQRQGFILVQCFTPLRIDNYLTIATELGRIARDAFEGRSSPGGIWFNPCRVKEIGTTDGWFQVNAIAEFTYDEVK